MLLLDLSLGMSSLYLDLVVHLLVELYMLLLPLVLLLCQSDQRTRLYPHYMIPIVSRVMDSVLLFPLMLWISNHHN